MYERKKISMRPPCSQTKFQNVVSRYLDLEATCADEESDDADGEEGKLLNQVQNSQGSIRVGTTEPNEPPNQHTHGEEEEDDDDEGGEEEEGEEESESDSSEERSTDERSNLR